MSQTVNLLSQALNNIFCLFICCALGMVLPNTLIGQVDSLNMQMQDAHLSTDTTQILDTILHDTIRLDTIRHDTIGHIDTIGYIDTIGHRASLDSLGNLKEHKQAVERIKRYTNQRNAHLKDSLALYYRYDAEEDLYQINSTVDPNTTHEDDWTKRANNEYLHLGNIGSSATPMVYNIDNSYHKDIGFHQYDFFNSSPDSFKYYQVLEPYSYAYFNTGSNKNNFSTGIKFINRYQQDLNLFIDFRRINQEGLYTGQKTKHSDFKTSLYWDNNRHELFFLYHSRTNTEQINGGVLPGQDYEADENRFRSNMALNLSGANIRHYSTGLNLTNKYLIGKVKDVEIKLYHQVSYQHKTYNFHDKVLKDSSNILYYVQLLKDDRGIRHNLDQKIWNNTIGTSFNMGNYIDLNAAIRFQNNKIENDYYTEHSNLLDLITRVKFSIQRFDLIGKLDFNITGLENSSNLELIANINFGQKIGSLAFTYHNLRKPASYIQQLLILNDDLIWDNKFKLQAYNSLKIAYNNDYINSKLDFTSIIINDLIYFNEDQILKQNNSSLYIQQFNYSQAFNLWKLHSDHHIMVQLFSDNLLGLPTLFTKHNIYFKHQFKSSDKSLKIGANIRYTMADNLLKYQASLGTFYKSDQNFDDYWTSEVYLAARISTFRFYIKYTNIDQLFDNKIDFQVLNNPQFDSSILFGIDWIFYN